MNPFISIGQAPTGLCSDAPILCNLNDLDGYSGTMSGTLTGGPATICVSDTPDNMHWWAFVAGGSIVTINIVSTNCTTEGGMTGASFGVYEGCGFETSEWCSSECGSSSFTENISLTGLTIGQSYYLYMNGCNGSVCDYMFDIISSGGVVHPNDGCTGALLLVDDTGLNGNTNICATPDYDDCSNGNNTNTVWYTFTTGVSDNAASFNITSNDGGISNFNAELYSDCAGSLIGSSCNNGDGMPIEFNCLFPNTTYYLQIGTNAIDASANFDVIPDFFQTTGFDNCNDPMVLSPPSCGVTLSEIQNIENECPEITDLGTSCPFSSNPTVWYSFNIPTNQDVLSITNFSGAGYALFNTQCPSGSPEGGDCFMVDNDFAVVGGNTYYLAIMGNGLNDFTFDYSYHYNGGNCNTAIDIGALDFTCIPVSFGGVSESCTSPISTGCMSGISGHWFTFNLNSSLDSEIEIVDDNGNSNYEIYTGNNCSTMSLVSDCSSSFTAISSNQYWVFISEISSISLTSCPCDISNILSTTLCLDNDTDSNPTDDIIELSLQVNGQNTGANYSISVNNGTITPMTGDYNNLSVFQLEPGSAGAGTALITLIDNQDPGCIKTVSISDPGTCSFNCGIISAGLTNVQCNNNLTPDVESDDYITFELNPDGFNLSTVNIYNVSVPLGTISPVSAFYNQSTEFTLQTGSAGVGNIVVTIEDEDQNTCQFDVEVADPGVCSTDPGTGLDPIYSINVNCLEVNNSWSFGGTDVDYSNFSMRLDNGNTLICGSTLSNDIDVTNSYGGTDAWAVLTSLNGDILWEKNYGGSSNEEFFKSLQMSNGNFLLGGTTRSNDFDVSINNGAEDIWLVSVDMSGNIVWESSFGGLGPNEFRSMCLLNNGNIAIIGSGDEITNGMQDAILIEVDINGNELSSNNFGGTNVEIFTDIIQNSNDEIILLGNTDSNNFDVSNNYGLEDVWLVCIDELGNIKWEQNYGGSGTDLAYDIMLHSNGDYYILGHSESADFDFGNNYGQSDIFVMRVQDGGALVWAQNYGSSGVDEANSSLVETEEGILISGLVSINDNDVSDYFGGEYDGWLCLIEENSSLIWNQNFGGTGHDLFTNLSVSSSGNLFLTGSTSSTDLNLQNDPSNGSQDFWMIELQEQCQPFITTWVTGNPGLSCNSCVLIRTNPEDYVYNYDVDWENDGTYDDFGLVGDVQMDYGVSGEFEIAIRGTFPHLNHSNDNGDNDKLINVNQWGQIEWESMALAFNHCDNLTQITAIDAPDLTNVTDMSGIFQNAINFNTDLANWGVENVTNMNRAFANATTFSGNIISWNTTNVTNMDSMFFNATDFNFFIGNWDVSEVTNMNSMFYNASSFNQNIGNWNVENVTTFESMFNGASSFDQNLNLWDVRSATDMEGMFNFAENFNQDLNSWDVSNVIDFRRMFSNATNFDFSLENWTMTNAQFLVEMLDDCGLSRANYEAILSGWASNSNTPNNLVLGALNLEYCEETGRNILIDSNNWNIDGDIRNCAGRPFITTWKTDNPGSSCNTCISIETGLTGASYEVDWDNDGVYDEVAGDIVTHDYGTAGTYIIRIRGDMKGFWDAGDQQKLLAINQWGDIQWERLENAFRGCSNLRVLADDAPNLSSLSLFPRLTDMFRNCISLNDPMENWDLTGVQETETMFSGCTAFNQDLSSWNVSSIRNMASMFSSCTNFNQDLSSWDVSNVTDMSSMFNSSGYNQDLNTWNVSNVTDMSGMFGNTTSFNQDLSNWDVSNVIDMSVMFNGSIVFNRDLSGWDVSNVTNMRGMFSSTQVFNGSLNNWDVSNVMDFRSMFNGAQSFDQPLNNWIVSSASNMSSMFGISPFNQDISSWDVSNVEDFSFMFNSNAAFNQNISDWNVASGRDFGHMFKSAFSFDQNLSNWQLGNVVFDEVNLDFGLLEMLDFSGLSMENYEATLLGWSENSLTPINLSLGALNLEYCEETGRNGLLNSNNWIIEGDIKKCGGGPFITTWKTDNPGTSCNTCISIETGLIGASYEVDWDNDGVFDEVVGDVVTHDYGTAGTFIIRIRGNMKGFWDAGDQQKLLAINQWGEIQWERLENAFQGCTNLRVLADDVPNLSSLSLFPRLNDMFKDCISLNDPMGSWDLTGVQETETMFSGCTTFNQDLSSWNVSSVQNMVGMFLSCTNFSQDLSSWDVSNVTDMTSMFNSSGYNQNLNTWDVSNVTDMSGMFSDCIFFNHPLDSWNVSNVTDMSGMFSQAIAFNQNLGNWDLSSLDDPPPPNNQGLSFMLDNCGMSKTNYEGTLNGWAANLNNPNDLQLGATLLEYCDESGRNELLDKGWSFFGDIKNCDCRTTDSLVLVDFYNDLGGVNWTIPWDLNASMDTWNGIQLNSNGCVTCIALDGGIDCDPFSTGSGNNLIGTIPLSIGTLENLEHLNLASNNLVGEIPATIGAISTLSYIRLSNNLLSGPIPSSINNLTLLTDLFVYDNRLSGEIPDMSSLQNLEYLILRNNELEGNIPVSLTQLSSAIQIDGQINLLDGEIPEGFASIATLEALLFSSNDLSGCFPSDFDQMCDITLGFINNYKLPNTGSPVPVCNGQSDVGSICVDNDETTFLDVIQSDCSCQGSLPPCVAEDSSIMADIYFEFNSTTWERPWDLSQPFTGWDVNQGNDQPWYGVTLNDIGCVTSLQFTNENIQSSLPPSLARLDSLNTLFMNGNDFIGCFPDEYQRFCSLPNINFPSRWTDGNNKLAWSGDISNFCDGNQQIGSPCDDGDISTVNDTIQFDCSCQGCPTLNAGGSFGGNYCQGQGPIDIYIQMFNFDSGGIWEDPQQTGLNLSNPLLLDIGALDPNDYELHYIVGDENCPKDTNKVLFTIHPNYKINTSGTFCDGENFIIESIEYTETILDTIILQSENGCDSIIYIDLLFLDPIEGEWSVSGCDGDIYQINGEDINITGEDVIYKVEQSLTSIAYPNCDSTLVITITSMAEPSSLFMSEICSGEEIEIGGIIYSSSNLTGFSILSGQAANGCDSIVNVELTITSDPEGEMPISACQGETIIINGMDVEIGDLPSSEQQVLSSIAHPGCDSILTIQITPLINIESSFNGFICDDEDVVIGSQTFNAEFPSGVETLFGEASNGCDSIINVELTHVEPFVVNDLSIQTDSNYLEFSLLDFMEDPQDLEFTFNIINYDENYIESYELDPESGILDVNILTSVQGIVNIEFEICHESCLVCDTGIISIDKKIDGYTEFVITCNGDNVNDRLIMSDYIEDLENAYPCNEIIIFNRWGQKVYEAQPYNNNWCGTFMNTGNPIPEGTYYFTLDLFAPGTSCGMQDALPDNRIIYGAITLLR